ncbi:hypothetical protein O3G_MSEX000222 [Manduca sexta]|nr:hypothetical protein O3G_MSEX000222 [Manduca sexta]
MDEKEELKLQVFNGTAYDKWKFRLKLFLEMKDCYEVIELQNRPDNITEQNWKTKEIKAKNYIVNSVSNSQLELIINEITAKEMIHKFDSIYATKSSANKLLSKRRLLDLKMNENDDPAEFLNKFEAHINNLIGSGEIVTQEDKLNYLLLCLPQSFSQIVDIVDALPDKEKSVDYVKSKLLLTQKIKETEKCTQASSQAFRAGKEEKKCYNCGNPGHYQRNCPTRQNQVRPAWRGNWNWRGNRYFRGRGQHRGGKGTSGRWQSGGTAGTSVVQSAPVTNSFNVEVMSSQVVSKNCDMQNEVSWLLDSGCSDHIINNEKYFCEYKNLNNPVDIRVGDGFSLKTNKIGNILMYFNVKGQWLKTKIYNVYYVPTMRQNLLSVSSITSNNNVILFNNDNAQIYGPNNNQIACAIKKNKLFLLNGKVSYENVSPSSYVSVGMSEKEKWHRILGHTNFYNVSKLCENNLCIGLPQKIENDYYYQCEICLENKMSNLPFNSNKKSRTTDLLQIIHTDVNGPINPIGFGGEKYFVSFIDDFSKLAKVYCINSKSEVYDCFVNYVNLVENQTGKRVKEIRCDNGTEYLNRNFFEFSKQKGIYIKPCPAYTHQLNGVAERYNRTVMDRARCLLAEAKIDKCYWPECVRTAAYLGNRLLTNTLIKRTPYEIFLGRKPDVTNLKIYGSEAFVRTPEQRRTSKLYPKAEKGILVGYSDMGYRILIGNKVIVSRHVTFIEKRPQYINFDCGKETDNEDNGMKQESEDENPRNDRNDQEDEENVECKEIEENKKEDNKEVKEIRIKRTKKMPKKYEDYVVHANFCNVNLPENYEEAINSSESKKWKRAMDEEIQSLEENNTWKIVKEPLNKKIIEVKWIYRIKSNGNYKARVVAKGFQQIYSENEEIYSPVARMTTLKIVLSTACLNGWEIEQMDVETAFLNGNIKSEVYIYPPDGYEIEEGKVYLLKKSLYGLRESPRDWYECFHNFMEEISFKRSDHDYCLYTGCIRDEKVYIILYVDDLLVVSSNINCIKEVKNMLNKKFRMKDLGRIKQYLGINIEYKKEEKKMYLSQEEYIKNVASKFQIINSKGYETPMEINLKLEPSAKINENFKYRNLIGALLYVANGTRPDISYSVNYLSRFQNSYDETHYKYALRVLKYLYNTRKFKLNYNANYENIIDAYVDADWGADIVDRKSTTGIVIKVYGNTIFWKSQKQKIVSRASTHAEYYALADCVEEVLPIKGVLSDLDVVINCIKIYEDNTGAIALSKNGKFCKNSKHIDISYHFVHDFEKKGIINVCKINTEEQIADILTKSLCKAKHKKFRYLLGVRNDDEV